MTQHDITVNGMNPNDLAVAVSKMRYDALTTFLIGLSLALGRDGQADLQRDRVVLAQHLINAATDVGAAAQDILAAWQVCEPHMNSTGD